MSRTLATLECSEGKMSDPTLCKRRVSKTKSQSLRCTLHWIMNSVRTSRKIR